MIWYYLLLFVTTILSEVFSFLPVVTKLPSFLGADVDGSLVSGISMLHNITGTFWMIGDVLTGFTILLGWYVTKMVLVLFLGHRAPVQR